MNEHQPHFDYQNFRFDGSRPFRVVQDVNFPSEVEREFWEKTGTILSTKARISDGLMELLESKKLLGRYNFVIKKGDEEYAYVLVPNDPTITIAELSGVTKHLQELLGA